MDSSESLSSKSPKYMNRTNHSTRIADRPALPLLYNHEYDIVVLNYED